MPTSLRDLYDELRTTQGTGERGRAATTSEDPFVLKLAQVVLAYAVEISASDIHIEPTAVGARVRYRIDGLLHEMLQVPQEIRDPLIRSIKIKANMATDVVGRSRPQDGRLDLEAEGKKLDLRLSSFPTLFGDVIAIRILDRSAPLLKLEQVGFPPFVQQEFSRLLHRPNGLVLVTGPTGSGKTTTLYAALNTLRSPYIKIITLEDPIEYQVEGINQGQVHTQIGLTFASGLRAILRQDANIILVGEIRDKETAEISIRAALTGHLVLSTMHTRHSVGATTRLMDMGIEPHLILASVTGVIAQRLVRVLCPQCKVLDPLAAKAFTKLWTQETGSPPTETMVAQLRKGSGCTSCNATGYHGRIGLFEILVLNDDLKELILKQAAAQLYREAVASGKLRTLMRDGLDKVAQGVTTVDEILRVTGETEARE